MPRTTKKASNGVTLAATASGAKQIADWTSDLRDAIYTGDKDAEKLLRSKLGAKAKTIADEAYADLEAITAKATSPATLAVAKALGATPEQLETARFQTRMNPEMWGKGGRGYTELFREALERVIASESKAAAQDEAIERAQEAAKSAKAKKTSKAKELAKPDEVTGAVTDSLEQITDLGQLEALAAALKARVAAVKAASKPAKEGKPAKELTPAQMKAVELVGTGRNREMSKAISGIKGVADKKAALKEMLRLTPPSKRPEIKFTGMKSDDVVAWLNEMAAKEYNAKAA